MLMKNRVLMFNRNQAARPTALRAPLQRRRGPEHERSGGDRVRDCWGGGRGAGEGSARDGGLSQVCGKCICCLFACIGKKRMPGSLTLWIGNSKIAYGGITMGVVGSAARTGPASATRLLRSFLGTVRWRIVVRRTWRVRSPSSPFPTITELNPNIRC